MAGIDFPINERQLQFHLEVAECEVRVLAQADGYTLQVGHSDLAHTLFTQRGNPRVFKNLTTVAAFLKERGVKIFSVILEQIAAAPASGIEAEFEKRFVEAMSGAEPPRQRPSRRSMDSFSLDNDWEDDDDLV
ncbi:MAG: hypothetical protein P0Y58_22305 [Candidatus Pseudomonas phytovorans]|uniref:Uncharacterized protein n=1 Tax=Candidatus Pseudomonas phytovorans TaxID=3121377 RepID=A0AAJ6BBC6_9PSED|nr:hypothetical protein [Pseudomonas sp.]WEK29599.1 MAG: hypothetical protein P0Y58_22305 [Pseudomonas sp.]